MANPARDLANLLDEWTDPQSEQALSVFERRGGPGADGHSVEFWRRHGEAFAYIVELERRMDDLERAGHADVAASRGVLPACYRALVLPEQTWHSATGEPLSPQQMASLRLLATLIDVTEGRPEMTFPERRALHECIDDALEALAGTADLLEESERRYILNLLNSIQALLNEKGVMGAVNLTSLVDQLSGALLGAGLTLSNGGEVSLGKQLFHLAQRVTAISRLALYDAAAVATIAAPLIAPLALESGAGSK